MSQVFQCPLEELNSYAELKSRLYGRTGPVQATGCMESQKVHLMQ